MSSSLNARCAGATEINNHNKGKGDKLVFENIPYSMFGALIEEVSGLDAKYSHPLQGATYCTDNHADTFTLTVYAGEIKTPLAQTFSEWFMSHQYEPYASNETSAAVYQ